MSARLLNAALLAAAMTLGSALSEARAAPHAQEALAQAERRTFELVNQSLKAPLDNSHGGIAWGSSYHLMALAELLEVTRDERYADLFVRLAGHVDRARDDRHARRDEFRGRVLKAWGSTKYSNDRNHVWAVHTGMIAAPLANFARIVRADPALSRRYGEAASRFLSVAREAVAEHVEDYRRGPRELEGHLFDQFLKKHVPLNMQTALARAWLYIDEATGDTAHRPQILALARFMRNRMKVEDGAFVWPYWPALDGAFLSYEDISHAAINVDFIVLCYERGLLFDRQDLEKLEKTLLTRAMPAPDRVAATVAGTGRSRERAAMLEMLRWHRIAGHSEASRQRLLALCAGGGAYNADQAAACYRLSSGRERAPAPTAPR